MNHRKQNLDWDKIPSLVNTFFGTEGETLVETQRGRFEFRQIVDGKEILLVLFRTKEGLTTITYNQGIHIGIQQEAAEYILQNALIDPRKNIDLAFKHFDEDDLNLLIQYLTESGKLSQTDERIGPIKQRIIRCDGCYDDHMTLIYFPSTNTLQIQGRPISLYAEITAFLTDFLSLEDIIEAQSQFSEVPIQQSDIEYELEARMPNSFPLLDGTTNKMLIAAAAFCKIDVELPDYSAFAFPALRALEGHLKKVLGENNIAINNEGFGPFFNHNGYKYSLMADCRAKINCPKTCVLIEDAYNFYNRQRHSLFHAQSAPVASRIIEKPEEVIDIIHECFSKIENHYRSLNN